MNFTSTFEKVGSVTLPTFSGIRIMMMPVRMGDIKSLPDYLSAWKETVSRLFKFSKCKEGIGYLTIDEKVVEKGLTHRREGLHVDGIYQGSCGGWGGGDGGGWGSVGNGMLTVSNYPGCIAYNQDFQGFPGMEGECDHLKSQCRDGTIFNAHEVFWLDGLCVHESMKVPEAVKRQFVRLSNPSTAPWFEGYTENSMGVKPTGKILPRRSFLDM